jgi:hypothetical protein
MSDSGSRSRGRLRIPRKAWILLTVILVIGALILVKSNSTVLAGDMTYQLTNSRTISLKVAAADPSWTRITSVKETDTEVRIAVETLTYPIPVPQSGGLAFRELTVSLTSDLAARTVVDATGIPIRATQ